MKPKKITKTWHVIYILESWNYFGDNFFTLSISGKAKSLTSPSFCARPLIYRLNLESKPTIKCVNHLQSSVQKTTSTTIHTWPQVGSSWLLAPVLSSSLHYGHDIQCTSKYRTVGGFEKSGGTRRLTSMTQLLIQSVALSTRPSFRAKTNNQSIKKFLILVVNWVKVVKKWESF